VILRLVLVAILVLLLVRFLIRLGALAAAVLREGAAPPMPGGTPAVALVPCGRCGVFLPRSAAKPGAGDTRLCAACARA
jgi:hypothetical protein